MSKASASSEKDDPENRKMIVIKKYSNRRLYDTSASKYIVLQDIVKLINDGVEFRIEDAKSGEDITRTILNQIIFEQETQPTTFLFPLEFQKQLIRMYGDTYGQLIPDFLTQSMTFFTQERHNLASAWQQMMSQNTENFLKQSGALAQQNMELFRKTWDVFGVMEQGAKDASEPKEEDPEVSDLQAQLDALQEQLQAMKK